MYLINGVSYKTWCQFVTKLSSYLFCTISGLLDRNNKNAYYYFRTIYRTPHCPLNRVTTVVSHLPIKYKMRLENIFIPSA